MTGEDTGHPIPKADKSGVQVRVLDAGVTRTAEAFANAQGFDIPLDDGDDDIDLEIPGGEHEPDNP